MAFLNKLLLLNNNYLLQHMKNDNLACGSHSTYFIHRVGKECCSRFKIIRLTIPSLSGSSSSHVAHSLFSILFHTLLQNGCYVRTFLPQTTFLHSSVSKKGTLFFVRQTVKEFYGPCLDIPPDW